MDTVKLQPARVLRPLLAVVLLVGVAARYSAAQQPQSQNQSPNQNQNQKQDQAQPDSSAPSAQASSTEKPEVKITPREAEELFHSVDEIMSFDSQQTGLAIKRQVKRRLTSRTR